MHTYTATLIADCDISKEQTERLCAACDDVAVSSSRGIWQIEFDREADT